ncbi:sodium:proton antiporter [uncultured Leuconostoc sp.]|uniref:cation:proton antiporter n=2 Tax=Leuconostoc TaxID=1243 RepID=UPI002595DEDA|nr:sodium:proton antiporter [uncultured Leuconostoc sp.]
MNTLTVVSLLLIGIISTNMIKQFIPKLPETFIFILVGIGLSFTPTFHHFELEPEFFMLVVIAPLMFLDGQQQSFAVIKKRFRMIFTLSVLLAAVSAIAVGFLSSWIESAWPLPLAIALAAIVVPTDAVAVKSLTAGTEMPTGVNNALELESLFNDATGLVILDLALSVLKNGHLSLFEGLAHFVFVAGGGVIIGIIGGFAIVWVRSNITFRTLNPDTTVITISLLTPFAIYLLAESAQTSGILAVVATGIVHNWESRKLKLTSTNVQLTQTTIWQMIATLLNAVVFLLLGIALPTVWQEITAIGFVATLQLIGLAILIYLLMFAVRFIWATYQKQGQAKDFFGPQHTKTHTFNARVFATSGVHGTVTLAMAFSLPHIIGQQPFPFREQLIIVATIVILLSMIVSAVALPLMLPKKQVTYTQQQLIATRNAMVDFAILQIRQQMTDQQARETVTNYLQSQKGWHATEDKQTVTAAYQTLFSQTQAFIANYLQSQPVTTAYPDHVILAYQKIMTLLMQHHDSDAHGWSKLQQNISRRLRQLVRRWQWQRLQVHFLKTHPAAQQTADNPQHAAWQALITDLLALNDAVDTAVNAHLDDILQARVDQKQDTHDIHLVRRAFNHYFARVRRDYDTSQPPVDSQWYIQAFQAEYSFVQQQVATDKIPVALATALYTEINQAQSLQLQQTQLEA